MATDNLSSQVQIGAQGRLVIPAPLRKALHLKPGDRLVARKIGDSLVLEPHEAIEKRLQDRFRHIPKEEVSLVDELIAERRAEAAKEAAEEGTNPSLAKTMTEARLSNPSPQSRPKLRPTFGKRPDAMACPWRTGPAWPWPWNKRHR